MFFFSRRCGEAGSDVIIRPALLTRVGGDDSETASVSSDEDEGVSALHQIQRILHGNPQDLRVASRLCPSERLRRRRRVELHRVRPLLPLVGGEASGARPGRLRVAVQGQRRHRRPLPRLQGRVLPQVSADSDGGAADEGPGTRWPRRVWRRGADAEKTALEPISLDVGGSATAADAGDVWVDGPRRKILERGHEIACLAF